MTKGWGVWTFRQQFTSGVGGTTGITHDLSAGAGNVLIVDELLAVGAIAATGTLDIDLIDEDGAIVAKFADLAAATGPTATVPRLNDDILSTSDSNLASSEGGVLLAGPDLRLRITPGNLAQNDTVTLSLKARVWKGPGTWVMAATGSYLEAVETVDEIV